MSGFKELSLPWYSDQILPFDISVAFTNEYGAAAASKIYAVEILNEGYGISIDDAVSEMQATFVARGISPMQSPGNAVGIFVIWSRLYSRLSLIHDQRQSTSSVS